LVHRAQNELVRPFYASSLQHYDYKFEFDLDYSSYYYLRLKNEETPPEEFFRKSSSRGVFR